MKKTGIITLFFLAVTMIGFAFSGQTASAKTQKELVLKPNVAQKIQLDGKGKKETLLFTTTETKKSVAESTYDITTKMILKINGKVVEKTTCVEKGVFEGYESYPEVLVTDVNVKDKAKDIFFSYNTGKWCGSYKVLKHLQYKKGKVIKDDMLKTFAKVKSKEINLLESNEGLKGDMSTAGKGILNWNVCIINNAIGYAHGTVPLKLVNSKFVIDKSNLSGVIKQVGSCVIGDGDFNNKVTFMKNLKVYKTVGKKKGVKKIETNMVAKLTKIQIFKKKLYIYVNGTKGVKGWISTDALTDDAIELTGTLHA